MQPEDIPRVAPPVVAIYGQESENEVLADELALDGYDVRLVSDPAMLGEVDLIVFGRTSQRGASLGALRALRQGQLGLRSPHPLDEHQSRSRRHAASVRGRSG